MGHSITPHFTNDIGAKKIKIGVKEFMCIGATAPFDHPHVYLDMGQAGETICPYCSTLFVHDDALGATETDPVNCLAHSHSGATT